MSTGFGSKVVRFLTYAVVVTLLALVVLSLAQGHLLEKFKARSDRQSVTIEELIRTNQMLIEKLRECEPAPELPENWEFGEKM